MSTSLEEPKKVRKFLSLRMSKSDTSIRNAAALATSSSSTSVPPSPSIRKVKSFKKIRGFLTGQSRRERKAKKLAALAQSHADGKERVFTQSTPPTEDDDEESVYGVDLDERSVAAPPTPPLTPERRLLGDGGDKDDEEQDETEVPTTIHESAPIAMPEEVAGPALQVVLLLMDPFTRRFELLQLEFDSHKAVVNDVLSQVPHSVTEPALRKQTYNGICDRTGTELINNIRLAEYCKGNEVLVAIPNGIPSKECARLARPILNDDKVISMLKSSGIDVSGWKDPKEDVPKKSHVAKVTARETPSPKSPIAQAESSKTVANTETEEPEVHEEEPAPKKKRSSILGWTFSIVFIGILAFVLQVVHTYISSPIPTNQVVSPGVWLSRCGLLAFRSDCENAFLHVGRDGVLSLYGPDKELVWQMVGSVCPEESETCVDGLTMKDNGVLTIGGKTVTTVTLHGAPPAELSPWPFAATPKIRVVRPRK